MFDPKIVENADTIDSTDGNTLEIHRDGDLALYHRRLHDWRVLVDVTVNGQRWYSNYEVDEEVEKFWSAALAREFELGSANEIKVKKETLAAEHRLRGEGQ